MSNTIQAPGADVRELAARVQAVMQGFAGVVPLGGNRYQTSSTTRPTWTIVLAVVLFPVGLLFLLIKNETKGTVAVVDAPRGAAIVLSGELDRGLRSALEMAATPPPGGRESVGEVAAPPPALGAVPAPPPPLPSAPMPAVMPPAPAVEQTIVRAREGGLHADVQQDLTLVPMRWRVQPSEGGAVEVAVGGAVLVGRGPAVSAGDTPMQVDDLSVSKTHARISVDASGTVHVEDLHSTNGTALIQLGQTRPILKGEHGTALLPATVLVGDVRLDVTA